MSVTYNNTNYNGELDLFIYEALGIELDVIEKGGASLKIGVSTKTELDYWEADENPMTDYTEDAPDWTGGGSAQFTVGKRELNPEKAMVTLLLKPDDFIPVWDKYKSIGALTKIKMLPKFQMDILRLVKNRLNLQLSKLFWQGDTALKSSDPTNPMRFIDGVIKKLKADSDSNVIPADPQGNILESNIYDRLRDVYKLIPPEKLDDPNFSINLSTPDWRKLNLAENDVQKAFVGALDTGLKNMFLNHKIKHFIGIPEHHIIAANTVDNNVLSMWFNIDQEMGAIDVFPIANGSKKHGVRFDMMLDAQYRYGGHIVFYKPA